MVIALCTMCAISIFGSLLLYINLVSKYVDIKAELEGFKRSTHKVQLIDTSNKKTLEDITKYQKEYREEAQEAFPEFATDDEDLELKGL